MQRSAFPLFLALGLVVAGIAGCLADIEDLCQTDADCPNGGRCKAADSIKYCAPGPQGEGGSGGNGGTGGDGGAGGEGGEPAFEAVADIDLSADEALSSFLQSSTRKIGAVALRYETGGKERLVEVDLDEAVDLPFRLTEVRLPLATASETLALRVEAHALRIDESLAVFATGQASAELDAEQTGSLAVELTLDPDFDGDLDGDPDLTDCAPDNPARHNDVKEVCDGEIQGCDPSYCYIELGDRQSVRDIACSPTERKCAVVIGEGENGTVRIFDSNFDAVEVEGIDKALGVSWSGRSGGDPFLTIVAADQVSFSSPAGDLASGSLTPSTTLAGPIRTLSSGNVSVSAGAEPHLLQIFDPNTSKSAVPVGCDSDGSGCNTITLEDLSDKDENDIATDARIKDAVLYKPGAGDAAIYFMFERESRLALARFNSSRTLQQSHSGMLPPFGTEPPRAITGFSGETRLFVATGVNSSKAEAYWFPMSNSIGSHQSPTPTLLPPGSCPAALDATRSDEFLLMADDCNGMLWKLPLDAEGKPKGEDFVPHTLEGCDEPFVLASLPAAAEDDPDLTFVGCKGQKHILVHGRY